MLVCQVWQDTADKSCLGSEQLRALQMLDFCPTLRFLVGKVLYLRYHYLGFKVPVATYTAQPIKRDFSFLAFVLIEVDDCNRNVIVDVGFVFTSLFES